MRLRSAALSTLLAAATCGAVVCAPASAATDTRPVPQNLTASTTPHFDGSAPYRFTTTGRLTPGAVVTCPPGTTPAPDNPYCSTPARSVLCKGTVAVRFRYHTKTISLRRVALRSDCTYKSAVAFAGDLHAVAAAAAIRTLTVTATFLGSPTLRPRSAPAQTVRVGSAPRARRSPRFTG